MKKVRFVTSKTTENFAMSDSECQSPRPFIERQIQPRAAEPCYNFTRVLPYNKDPVQRFECGNSSPYPSLNKTHTSFPQQDSSWKPSDDLDLSLLDASSCEPRLPVFSKSVKSSFEQCSSENRIYGNNGNNLLGVTKSHVLTSIENQPDPGTPPNVLVKDNSFFIRRDNLDKYHFNVNPMNNRFNHLNLGKENDPFVRKAEAMNTAMFPQQVDPHLIEPAAIKPILKLNSQIEPPKYKPVDHCQCHHCLKIIENTSRKSPVADIKAHMMESSSAIKQGAMQTAHNSLEHLNCHCSQPKPCSNCYQTQFIQQNHQSCSCHNSPQNAVDKKTWGIEKFEQRKQSECMEVEKQTNVSKEKREPTVADLFKIIKLQNEQLQLLQEKVDKFISTSQQNTPTISCSTEHVSISGNNQMSIGVMTSFEMVRTSTVINKEVVKQTNENQIQCNRSQISIKEVVSKPGNLNFLDGITPVNNQPDFTNKQPIENGTDKTLNELSLYNIQVDNATTPNISPEQSLYLDVRDYSESDTSSNDQSNVGWTYYNKVMTHVNGMLQDSEMPSSASAMFKNMRQQCAQMQIDKSNISVTKRVKFGDDPLGIRQPHLYATDTSLKMNQLAAKYLDGSMTTTQRASPKSAPIDMSFATRNYMERHKLLQGASSTSKSPKAEEIPRFLDITALKQQPKFL